MADPVYGPGGSGYYIDPATGQRVWQTRYEYGPNAYDPKYETKLVYDPQNVATDGSGTPTDGRTYTPATTPEATGLTQEQASAKAIIAATLDEYGLGGLADRAWQMYLQGEPIEQVMLEIRKTPEYQHRFAGMAELQKKGRAISEAQYIDLERQYVSLFRAAGLPAGFYDSPDDFASFIGKEVSPQEMGQRLDVARQAVYEEPPGVRDELQRLYGLDEGGMMAFLLNPNKALPVIQQQLRAGESGYAAKAAGYGALTVQEAEQLGYTDRSFDQLTAGFDQLARESELFAPIIGEQGDTIDRQTQLDATFGGNTAAQRRIERRARERAAAFQGGGGFSATQGGVSGLGSAAT